jgi:hypothetical protein
MVHAPVGAPLARQRQHELWGEGAQARLARQAPPDHATPGPLAAPAPADGQAWLARRWSDAWPNEPGEQP